MEIGFTFIEHADPDDDALNTLDPNDISYSSPNVLTISNLTNGTSTDGSSGLIEIAIPLSSINQPYASCRFWNESLLDGNNIAWHLSYVHTYDLIIERMMFGGYEWHTMLVCLYACML